MTLRSRTRPLLIVVALYSALLAACNAGSGTAILLPAGPQSTQPPGDLVVYVSEAIGDRVAAYRLGADGLLPASPFSTLAVENPRRLTLAGDVLYVATATQVLSLALAADGGLPTAPTASTLPSPGADVFEIEVVGNTLYAAFAGFGRLQAFRLGADGQVSDTPLTSSGDFSSDYRALAVAGGFLYAAARATARIDTYLIGADGSLPDMPETQNPSTFVSLPDDLLVRGGVLYASNKGRRRILAFAIRADGLLPEDPASETARSGAYEDMVLDGDTLYACAFNEGRIDTFRLDPSDGSLADAGPVSSTREDETSFPTSLSLRDGILYVAQAGADRIDAYLITPAGVPTEFPSSSTVAVADSFPTDLVLYDLP